MYAEDLSEQYRKLKTEDLVRRAKNSAATAASRQAARAELDRRYAEGTEDDDPRPASTRPAVERGEVTPLALVTLGVMGMLTVGLFVFEPKLGLLMAVATAKGFSFVFPVLGRIVGLALIGLGVWVVIEVFKTLPIFYALILSLLPLTIAVIGVGMLADSSQED